MHMHICTCTQSYRIFELDSSRTTGLAQLMTRGTFLGNTCWSEFESEAQPEAQANEVLSVRVPCPARIFEISKYRQTYNGLWCPVGTVVPNLLVCTLATRAFFRQRRAFEDIDALELWLAWACAVGTVSINTVVFLVCADPARGSTQIDRESLSGAAL